MWTMRRLLERVGDELPRGRWLEPCAGSGALIQAANEYESFRGIDWHACELRLRMAPLLKNFVAADQITTADYLATTAYEGMRFDVLITNPPYAIAFEVLQKAMTMADHVLLLLRLNFFGSALRHDFLRSSMPNLTWVLPNRPSFKGDCKTDSIEYAWFHWTAPFDAKTSVLELLDLTSLPERREGYLAPVEYVDAVG